MTRLFSVLGILWMAVALSATTGDASATTGETSTTTGETSATTGETSTTTGETSATTGETSATTGETSTTTVNITVTTGETSITTGETSATTGETSTTTGNITVTTGETSITTGETSTTTGNITVTTGETSTVTDKLPTTEKPDPCDSKPCGGGSTCEARADETFTCLCLPGDSYIKEANVCQKAKVFPGQISLKGLNYEDGMSDKTSAAFQNASEKVIAAMNKAFEGNKDYLECIVEEIRQKKVRTGTAEAIVDLKFRSESKVTLKAINGSITNCTVCGVEGFVATNLCEKSPCDESSTNCTSSEGSFSCTCNDGYIKSDFTDKVCKACPSGEKAVDSECVACAFGSSGFNCEENWQLILVIVGTVLGVLALSFLIALIVVSMKSPKTKFKKSKEPDDVKPYVSHFSTKVPLGGNSIKNDYTSQTSAPAGMPRIPRVTTTLDNRSNIEMVPSNSRQNLISSNRNSWLSEDQDISYSRPTNSYAQARPQSNPYNQNQAQYNPYAQNQGHSNPYFSNDRFN